MAKKEFIPIDLVKKFYAKGKSEAEVIAELRARGFTPTQIDKAIKAVPRPVEHKGPLPGPLPKELIKRPAIGIPSKAAPAPIQGAPVGRPPEEIVIPEELKLLEIPAKPKEKKPAKEKPAEKAAPKPKELPPELPKPVAIKVPREIRIEELIERIASEYNAKLESKMTKAHQEMQTKLKLVEELGERVREIERSTKEQSEHQAQQIQEFKDELENLRARFDALEKAFKEFAKFFKKRSAHA